MPRLPNNFRFILHLSRAEFETLYSIVVARIRFDQLPDGTPLDQAMRAVAVELALEHGYDFEGLRVSPDRELFALNDQPVEPRNVLFLQLLHQGGVPDLETHVPVAIAFVEELVPSFDASILHDLAQQMERDFGQIADLKPTKELRQLLRERLRERQAALERSEVN